MRAHSAKSQSIQVRIDPSDDVFEAELVSRSGDTGRVIYLILRTSSGAGRLSIAIRSKEQLDSLRDSILDVCSSADLSFLA